MKFLIAIKNTNDESKNILDIGCKIAEGFSADLTICYVGKRSKALIEGDVSLARLSMSEWNIYHPGLEVLEWAFNILQENGFAPKTKFDVENLSCRNFIKGDQISLSIASASIIAKIFRDKYMAKIGRNYPYFKWHKNAGYGTIEHREQIQRRGITKYHRKSFEPIKTFIQNNN